MSKGKNRSVPENYMQDSNAGSNPRQFLGRDLFPGDPEGKIVKW